MKGVASYFSLYTVGWAAERISSASVQCNLYSKSEKCGEQSLLQHIIQHYTQEVRTDI